MLCPRFAVIRQGRLVAFTSPSEARAGLAGRIFEGRVAAEEMAEVSRRLRVTQAVLVEGTHRVRIFQPDGRAPVGFEPVPPTLEDAYLLLMQDAQAAAGEGDGAGEGARQPVAVPGAGA